MVWDINTKFLPVEDHNRRQLLTKFEGSWCAQIWISCQNILKLKWAWQAQFLSYAFQILQKCITFEDAQMILLALLKILSLNRIFKKSIQLLVHNGAVLALPKGSFTNHVDKILTIFDHPPTSYGHLWTYQWPPIYVHVDFHVPTSKNQ